MLSGIGINFKGLTAAVVIAGVMVLTGCALPTSAADSEETPTATPTVESSTVAQWASPIAQQQADWVDWQESWDEANCSSIEANLEYGIVCRLQLFTASLKAQTTGIEYELATGPGKKGFIAEEPPAEIADLFENTRAAAAAVAAAGVAWVDAKCDSGPADPCGGLGFTYQSAIEDLVAQFDPT